MTYFWIGFAVGLCVGGTLGFIIAGLCHAAHAADQHIERTLNQARPK